MPVELRWRVDLTVWLAVLGAAPLFIKRFPRKAESFFSLPWALLPAPAFGEPLPELEAPAETAPSESRVVRIDEQSRRARDLPVDVPIRARLRPAGAKGGPWVARSEARPPAHWHRRLPPAP